MANKTTLITYKEFERYINSIRERQNLELSLRNIFNKYNRSSKDCASICFPSSETNLIELLEKITYDEDEWISYWVYELDFGQKYHKGCVEINGKLVALLTIYDLWNLLNDNPRFESE